MGNPIQMIPISAAALREIDLVGVFRYANTYESAVEMITSNDPNYPDFRKLITHTFMGLDRVEEAFEMASRTEDGEGNAVLKVVIVSSVVDEFY
jgi:L-iditol 2-dehydrogenase